MVVSSTTNNSQQLDALLRNCLSQRLEPNEFFEEACRMIIEENGQFPERVLQIANNYASAFPEETDIFPLALAYLKILFVHGLIQPQKYLTILTTFDCWTHPIKIEEIASDLESYIYNKRIAVYEGNSNVLFTQITQILDWYIYSIEKIVELINENNFDEFSLVFINRINAIKHLHERPFTALIIFTFLSEHSDNSSINNNINKLQIISNKITNHLNELNEKKESTSKEDEMEVDEEKEEKIKEPSFFSKLSNFLKLIDQLIELFPLFSTPPKSNWQPCREDFIHRKYRPALLSLGSIFAIFRVIKTADEVADTFLTVGNILGMEHEQIVEDLLRAGFLIQLETSNICSEQREREALADVFVFIKLPQVLKCLIQRGIQRQTISKALENICNCDSLLDQVDDKKSDNVFRFFLDGLKKADVVNSKEHEFLTKKRDLKRSQNEELPAGERQMIVRSELISRVQKAKRGIDTLVPENTERLLRRLLSLGEIPIDMLCSIYCACGELSLFSSKLAALNAQAQQPITGENVSGATTNAQGRLLIFDSTFLLMARIQHVFADMRLEELVGGRLHCAFYRWTQRYQKCIEESESMCFVLSSQTGGGPSNEDSTDSSFRSNFQRNQFQAMRSQKQPFWLAENNDFGNTIETVPLIGELLLEEFSRGSPNSNEINNIFWTFSQMSCLWLCLVQWLDAQQPTIGNTPRQAMARSMREFEVKLQQQKTASEKDNKDNGERLQSLSYSILIARRLLRQIVDQRIKKEHPYTWLVGFAQRPLPALPFGRKMSLLRASPEEINEENQRLKEVFLCANQQSWATPDAIAHINRCNESCRMDIWLQCWMRQMMNHQRIVTVDESELASELCLAATITYPVPCLCEMIKQLVECILFERATTSTSSTTIALQPNIHSAFVPNIVSAVSSTINSNEHSLEEQKHLTTNQQKQQTNIPTQQKHSLSGLEQQQKHSLQQQPAVKRHPVVGQLSTKATVIAKMLVRAMQLLLWAGDRRVLEKREREKRIQQFGLITQQQPSEQSSSSRKRSQMEINENICEEGQQQMDQTPCSSSSAEQQVQNEALGIQKKKSVDVSSSVVETCTSSMNETTTSSRLPKDALKAQLTVSNVFERFERIVRDCNLRPPVTFIIFFIHELAAAPQTEYWRRLVSIMPVNLIFGLSHLDPHAIPLDLFMRLYDPKDEKNRKLCLHYAFMIKKLGNI